MDTSCVPQSINVALQQQLDLANVIKVLQQEILDLKVAAGANNGGQHQSASGNPQGQGGGRCNKHNRRKRGQG